MRRNFIRFAAFATALITIASSAPCVNGDDSFTAATAEPVSPITREMDGHWAAPAVSLALSQGIVMGYGDGTFKPDKPVTRAEMAAMLSRILDWQVRAENTFVDIDESKWDADAILRANAAGVLLGDNQSRARPSSNITREEAVVMLSRAYNVASESSELSYIDAADISSWAYDAVAALTSIGAVHGRTGGFRPRESLTRAEAVTMIMNLLSLFPGETEEPDNTQESDTPGESDIPFVPVEPEPDYIQFGNQRVPILEGVPKSPLSAESFTTDERGRRTYNGIDTLCGIDVSSWQQDIDWQAVADDGVDFAIIRAAYRGYTVGVISEDTCFRKNVEGALAAGLKVGVYVFSQAITAAEAQEEAEFVLDLIADYDITFPVVFDWEHVQSKNARTNNLDSKTLTDCAITFCETIKNGGYTPVIYFYMSLAYNNLQLERLTDYDMWLAQYNEAQTFYYAVDMWQYTSGGTVNGVEGKVDMNISYKDYSK